MSGLDLYTSRLLNFEQQLIVFTDKAATIRAQNTANDKRQQGKLIFMSSY